MPNLKPARAKAKHASASKRSARATKPAAKVDLQIDARYKHKVNAQAIRAAACAALEVAHVRRKVTLTIAISGDATLRKLNKTFLDIDAPTDVLAFPLQNDDDEYLGDVVVSMMRVRAQAKRGGHEMIDELRLLVIHGVLHLLGHDHDTQANKKRMWAAQTRALKKIGAAIEGAR